MMDAAGRPLATARSVTLRQADLSQLMAGPGRLYQIRWQERPDAPGPACAGAWAVTGHGAVSLAAALRETGQPARPWPSVADLGEASAAGSPPPVVIAAVRGDDGADTARGPGTATSQP